MSLPCGDCHGCCENSPGWFAPGEIEAAAAHLGITPEEFIDRYCVIEWIPIPHPDDPDRTVVVRVYAPARVDGQGRPIEPAGRQVSVEYAIKPAAGGCIFLDRAGGQGHYCRIYPARPLECRQYHCRNWDWANPRHQDTAGLWFAAAGPDDVKTAPTLKSLVRSGRLPSGGPVDVPLRV